MHEEPAKRLDDNQSKGTAARVARRAARDTKVHPHVVWLIGLAMFWTLPQAHGDEARARLTVSASVAAYARLEQAETAVEVTAADIERGYLEIERDYRLSTNAQERVVLQANPRVGFAKAVDIGGLRAALRVLDQTVEAYQPPVGDFRLRFKVWLDPRLQAGVYPSPVQFAVTTL
jgi:hypothetical protein